MYERYLLKPGLLSHQRILANSYTQPTYVKNIGRGLSQARPSNIGGSRDIRHAVLISSYFDGMLKSVEAQRFLVNALMTSMHARGERIFDTTDLGTSATTTPNKSADHDILQALVSTESKSRKPSASWDQEDESIPLKIVYIPTALYGNRTDKIDTLEKALEEGQKRRKQITDHLSSLLGERIPIQAVTLDLDDGSVKHPQGPETQNAFPLNGKEALGKWKPHLVYVEGGNTFWLHHCMEKGGWKHSIRDAVTGGDDAAVYCGRSAGAIITGARVETATWKKWNDPTVVPGKETFEDWEGVSGLDLIDGLSIFPHMDDEWIDTVTEKKRNIPSPVVCVSDWTICLFDGKEGKFSVVSASE